MATWVLSTCRSKRKYLPKEMSKKHAVNKKAERGQLAGYWTQLRVGTRVVKMWAETWMDTKFVTTLTSMKPRRTTVRRRVKSVVNGVKVHSKRRAGIYDARQLQRQYDWL